MSFDIHAPTNSVLYRELVLDLSYSFCFATKIFDSRNVLAMSSYQHVFSRYLQKIKADGQYRIFFEHSRSRRHPIVLKEGQPILTWCSNDYLGLSQNPNVIESAVKAAKTYGVGAGGTRNISGTSESVNRLEKELANFHGEESSLTFSSAFAANYGMLTSIGTLFPNIHFFSDSSNHSSIIEGLRSTKNQVSIFKHNDLGHLAQLLKNTKDGSCIVTESVFSMDGSFAPLTEIVALSKKHESLVCVDEVHAVGLYGEHGKGLVEKNALQHDIDIVVGGFGKAFGTQGGYIVGKRDLIDCIRSLAKSFIFSTSTALPTTEATRCSLSLLPSMDIQRKELFANAYMLNTQLVNNGVPTIFEESSHIVFVPFQNAFECKEISQRLVNLGHYVQPINYPTVPVGQERLRITPSHLHTSSMIKSLVSAISKTLK